MYTDWVADDSSRSTWYVERMRGLAAAGDDLAGEARLVNALVAPGSRILDAGCGPGRVGAALEGFGHEVVGVDVDPVLVAAAREDHPDARFVVGDLTRLARADIGGGELFDAVGGYREDIFGEDYDFWLRAMAGGARHAYLDMPLALHRISDTQKTASLERAYESDIRSIGAALESAALTRHQREAGERAIAHRRRLIAEVRRPRSIATRIRRIMRRLLSTGPSR